MDRGVCRLRLLAFNRLGSHRSDSSLRQQRVALLLKNRDSGQLGERYFNLWVDPVVVEVMLRNSLPANGHVNSCLLKFGNQLQVGIRYAEFFSIVSVVKRRWCRSATHYHDEFQIFWILGGICG
jgi:hypothetical protein